MSIFSFKCEFWLFIIFILEAVIIWGIGNLNNHYCLLLLFIKYQEIFLILFIFFLSFFCFYIFNLGCWGVRSYGLCQSRKSRPLSKSYKRNEIVVFGFDIMCYFYSVFDHNGYWTFEFYVYFNEKSFSYNKLYCIFFNLYSQVIGLLNSFVLLIPEEEFDETDCKYLAMNINQFLFFQMVSYQEPQGILNGFYYSDSDLRVVSLIWGSSFCFYKFLESLFLLKIFMCLFYPLLKNPDWSSTNVFIYLLHTLYLADKKYFRKGIDYELIEIVNQLINYECDNPSIGLTERMWTFKSYLSNFFITSGGCYHGIKVSSRSGFSKFFLHSILSIPVSSYHNYKYHSFWEDCKYFFSYKEIPSSGLILLEPGKASGCNYFIYNLQSGFFISFSFLVFESIFNISRVLLVVSLYESSVMDSQYGEYGSAKSFLIIKDLRIQILGVSVMGASPLNIGGGLEASESYINSTNQPSDLKGVLFHQGKIVQKEEEEKYLKGIKSKIRRDNRRSSSKILQKSMVEKMKKFVKWGNTDGFERLYTNTDLGCQGSLHFTHKGLQGELFDMKLTEEEHSSIGFCQVMNFLDLGGNSPYMRLEKEEFITLSLGFKYLFRQGFCAKLSIHSYDECSSGGNLLKDSLYGVHYSSGGLRIQKERGVSLVRCLCGVKDSIGFYRLDSCIAGCENCCSLMNKYFYIDKTGLLQPIKFPLIIYRLPGSVSLRKLPLTHISYTYLDVLREFYFYFYKILPLSFNSVKVKETEIMYKGIKILYGYENGNLKFRESNSQSKINTTSGERVFEIFLKYLKEEYGTEEVFFRKINYNILHLIRFERELFGGSEGFFNQFCEFVKFSKFLKYSNRQNEEGERVFFNYGVIRDDKVSRFYNSNRKIKKLYSKIKSLVDKDDTCELTPSESIKLSRLEKDFETVINSFRSLDYKVISRSKVHSCLLKISSSSHFYTRVGGPIALEYKVKDCLPVKPSMDQFFIQDAGREEYISKFKEYLTSWRNMENYLSNMEFEKEMRAFKRRSVFKSTLLVCRVYRSRVVKWGKK